MMLCDVPLHPRTRSTKGPDCPNDIQKRLRSPRQHLDDRQHSINPLPKRPAIDQRTEFVRLVRIHELFRLDDTLLIFTSDHGEMLGSHGLLFKGSALFEELVNIPLLVRPPGGLAAGHRTQHLVSHVDLVPTIVGWCGGTAPGEIQGTDIRSLCEGGDEPVRDGLALEFHSSNWGETPEPLRGWRTPDWKYVSTIGGGDELYKLPEDPGETRNLIDDPESATAQHRLAAELEAWLGTIPDSWPEVPRPEREVKR